MQIMVTVPQGTRLPDLGSNVTVKRKPPKRAIAFDFVPPRGTFLVIPQPENVRDIPALIETACALAPTHHAVAFLPETEPQRNVLATVAPAYAFDALTLHLAGGLDSTLSLNEMCLDAMIRAAGRGSQPIALGHSSIISLPSLAIDSYLKVIARNFSSDTQARYLAPVFLATVTAPMQATHTDTSVLDLERTAYTPSQGVSVRDLPEGSNDGVHALHEWLSGLENSTIANTVLQPFRRRPDALLPNMDDFFAEAVRATGIEESAAETLIAAFADVAENLAPRVLFAVSANPEARARMDSIRSCLPYEVSYFDAETRTFYTSVTPDSPWHETDDSKAQDHPIAYLIDTHVRTLPWVNTTNTIVIADFTCTDSVAPLRSDLLMYTAEIPRPSKFLEKEPKPGMHAYVLNETLARADRLIARDSAQRDFLLGAISGLYRLNQYTYDEDLSLASLIDTEDGTRAACSAIEMCLHPFDIITNNAEYEAALFDVAVPALPSLPQRAVNKAKRIIRERGR
ncbi:MAG: hypothetical protein IKS49_02175 [Actinomycetaceae bacterium]|nr:hypothetical protein [Actinomycetaceae bacterium]